MFVELNDGKCDPTVDSMADRFEHRLAGNHPLGGVRHTRYGMRLWFGRLFYLTQGLDFSIQHIAVAGCPWDTDRQPYRNPGVHVVRLRWFRAVSQYAYLDTAVWEAACARMAAGGMSEASADPIED